MMAMTTRSSIKVKARKGIFRERGQVGESSMARQFKGALISAPAFWSACAAAPLSLLETTFVLLVRLVRSRPSPNPKRRSGGRTPQPGGRMQAPVLEGALVDC